MSIKKTLCVLLALIILVIGCVVSFADEIEVNLIEGNLKNSNATENHKVLSNENLDKRFVIKNKDLRALLEEKGYYPDDINITLDKYIETSITYDMTDVENTYLMKLLDMNYDFEKLVEIYRFLKSTNQDMSCIREIYDIAYPNFEGNSWIENAYDVYLGDEKCVLSPDDIIKYVDEGISVDEILICYELSLSNNKNIKQILDERVSGEEWETIIIPEVAIKGATKSASLDTIAKAFKVSKQTSREISSVMSCDEKGEITVKQDAIEAIFKKKQRIKTMKEKHGVVAYDDDSIVKEAKKHLKGIKEEKIKNLVSEGYRIKEIKNAIDGNSDGRSMKINEIINGTEVE